ncbi:MAG: hypothetical protein GY721_09955 [Deltaproteobacteria bacterium]|nr:hypothetical protein [Deltaproteobacteria bacterium]
MKIPIDLLLTLWRFARGDTAPRKFEQWLYSAADLEAALGEALYMSSIETDFNSRASVFQLKQDLFAFASAHDESRCQCVRHPNLTVVDMGEHEEFFSTLETTWERGQPYWWLFASECTSCVQRWLVASEERQ